MLLEREAPPVAAEIRVAEPQPEPASGLPPVLAILGMIAVLALLATTLIAICFLAAKLATGHAV